MAKSYTLNRFYREAKALLEKHNSFIDGWMLWCQFALEEGKGCTRLICYINYRNEEEGYTTGFFDCNASPANALADFEDNILHHKIDRKWEEV